MDNEMRMMFNAILEEMDRMEKRMDQRFERMEGRLEQLQHEVNACKLIHGWMIRHMDSLEEHMDGLDERMEGCEGRISKWERKQDKNLSLV